MALVDYITYEGPWYVIWDLIDVIVSCSVWRWKKSTRARMIALYTVGLSTKTFRNALFVGSTDSIIER
jgi:hypothetical protein